MLGLLGPAALHSHVPGGLGCQHKGWGGPSAKTARTGGGCASLRTAGLLPATAPVLIHLGTHLSWLSTPHHTD